MDSAMMSPEELDYFLDIFMKGFFMMHGFCFIALMIKMVRLMGRPRSDVLD